jgi:N-acetylneuraminate synthase
VSPDSTFVIAEAGVNHNGRLDAALRLVDEAAAARADAVKFQTFRAGSLVTAAAPRAEYQKRSGEGGDQHSLLRALELSAGDHGVLAQRCRDRGIEFMSSPFDVESLRLLVDACGVRRVKLGSGEITHGALLLATARTRLPLVLSTGMSTLHEIQDALALVAFGLLERTAVPSEDACAEAFASAEGQQALRNTVTLLHCNTAYPTPLRDANLRAMDALRDAFGLAVGYSDHTLGVTAAIAAVARGAVMIEKHFTLDMAAPGPDHAASLVPSALAYMVRRIREVEMVLGDGVKAVTASESGQRELARRGLVAARPIAAGQVIDVADLVAKRPAVGASPMKLWDVAGTVADRDYDLDEPVHLLDGGPRRPSSLAGKATEGPPTHAVGSILLPERQAS